MSAARKWPTPPEQVVTGLAYGRSIGLSFDDAWTQTLLSLYWGSGGERSVWRAAVEATRPEFEAAYLGRETPVSRALAAAVHGPSDPTRAAAIPTVALARVA